jgi:hypothetical protein
VKATEAIEVSRADDLLAQARALQSETLSLLLRADRASDLRTALAAVREARVHVELLSETLRQIAAAVDPTQDGRSARIASPGLRGGPEGFSMPAWERGAQTNRRRTNA